MIFANRNAQIDHSALLTSDEENFLFSLIWKEDKGSSYKDLSRLFYRGGIAVLDVGKESLSLNLMIYKIMVILLVTRIESDEEINLRGKAFKIDSALQTLFVQAVKAAKHLQQALYAIEYIQGKTDINLFSKSENNSVQVAREILKAFVDLSISDALIVRGLRVVDGPKGLFVSMPQEQGKDKKWYDTIRCVSPQVRQEIRQR